MTEQDNDSLASLIEHELMSVHGPMISNDELRKALGYVSMEAFRQAISRNTIPIPVFSLKNHRGKFALVRDIANWLATERENARLAMEFSRKDLNHSNEFNKGKTVS